MKRVIEYPDKTRDLLIDKYLNNPDEKQSIDTVLLFFEIFT